MNYQALLSRLSERGFSDVDPARLHGLMCGLICASERSSPYVPWMERVSFAMDAPALFEEEKDLLVSLYAAIDEQMIDPKRFELMLPGPRRSMFFKVRALSAWCQGFLNGLTLAGRTFFPELNYEMRGALIHFAEWASMDWEDPSMMKRREEFVAYPEFSDYVRMTVPAIYRQLNGLSTISGHLTESTMLH